MKKKRLGRSPLEIAPLVFGGNIFGWTADERTSFELLDRFVDRGLNLIDTADVYSKWVPGHQGGESETIIGKWLKQSHKREQVLIASKVGMQMGDGSKGLSPSHIRQSVDKSLGRLQTDHIDLYQSHEDDHSVPLEEVLSTYADLIKEGKVRTIGASNYKADRLNAALQVSEREGLPRYQSLQPEYNLYDRSGYEEALEPLCQKKEVGVISYWSLASGFLTGKYRSEADFAGKTRGAKAKGYLNDRGKKILSALDEVAKRHQAKQASVALAWLIERPGITAPIASATTLDQLEDLVAATELKLSQDDIDALTTASN